LRRVMAPIEPKVIGPDEYRFLSGIVPFFVVVVGLVGGIALATNLDQTQVVQQSYWSELLKVAGVSALPLVAVAVRLPRASKKTNWEKPARILVFIAFPVALLTIGICLYEVATTDKNGVDPGDFLVWVSAIGTGLILAAVAIGVMADVLDKIDPKANGTQ
jgi:hypothetical protein